MTPVAIVFLILSVVLVWGGLAVAARYYVRSGAAGGEPPRDEAGHLREPHDT